MVTVSIQALCQLPCHLAGCTCQYSGSPLTSTGPDNVSSYIATVTSSLAAMTTLWQSLQSKRLVSDCQTEEVECDPKHFKGMYNLDASLMPSRSNRLHRTLHYSLHKLKSFCSQHSHVKYGKYHTVRDNDKIKMKYVSHYSSTRYNTYNVISVIRQKNLFKWKDAHFIIKRNKTFFFLRKKP